MDCCTALGVDRLISREWIDAYRVDGTSQWGHVTDHAEVSASDYSSRCLGRGFGVDHAYSCRLMGLGSRIFRGHSNEKCDNDSKREAALFAGHDGLRGTCPRHNRTRA